MGESDQKRVSIVLVTSLFCYNALKVGCVDGLFECVRILWMMLDEKVQLILEVPIFKLPKKKSEKEKKKL